VNQQNWNKRKSQSKAVHKADQQQQEHYIHLKETLGSICTLSELPSHGGRGREGADGDRRMEWAVDP